MIAVAQLMHVQSVFQWMIIMLLLLFFGGCSFILHYTHTIVFRTRLTITLWRCFSLNAEISVSFYIYHVVFQSWNLESCLYWHFFYSITRSFISIYIDFTTIKHNCLIGFNKYVLLFVSFLNKWHNLFVIYTSF